MRQEKSCGAVIFRGEAAQRDYLVLHSTQGHWTLCKGHVEGDETERETAAREIREETALSVDFLDGFRAVITYSPRPGVSTDCQPEEVAQARFLPFEEALALLTHPSDREVLQKARAFLEGR